MTLAVTNPATGEQITEVATFDVADVPAIVARADTAQKEWAKLPPRERGEILRACWQGMLDNEDYLARLITSENGKPIADGHAEVKYAAEFFRWNSEEAVRLDGEVGFLPNGAGRKIVLRQPIGVVLAVTPVSSRARMPPPNLAPALAAGCAVIAKPASLTPITAVRLVDIFKDTGLPPDVFQVIPTTNTGGVVKACLAQDAVRKLSFTGSTEVGAKLLEQAAPRVVSCAMELGGNAP